MSAVFDQLRISDDGKNLFIDAHVNKASYFDNVYVKSITVCTEDQVSELDPYTPGEDYIYKQEFEPIVEEKLVPINKKIVELSEKILLKSLNTYGGIPVSFEIPEQSENSYVSVLLSGKFSVLETGMTPKMVIATGSYDPIEERFNSPEVLGIIDGYPYEEGGHRVWQFRGKVETKLNEPVQAYLYNQVEEGVFEYVAINETDDYNFLHFFWQAYALISVQNRKEVHLALTKDSFNEAFINNASKEDEGTIPSTTPIATVQFPRTDLSGNMFFVYIECDGLPASDTPCTLDEMTTLGVTFDYGVFYNQAMDYTKELIDKCDVPNNFVDFILNVEALKISVETDHYVQAIYYWKRLLEETTGGSTYNTTNRCGCHG